MKCNKKLLACVTAAGMILGSAGIASADNLVNDLASNANETKTIVQGGSTSVEYKINATGGSCDADDGSAAQVTVTAPAGVTMTSSEGFAAVEGANQMRRNISVCNVFHGITFTGSAVGTHSITAAIVDAAGDYKNQANWTLVVNASTGSGETPDPNTAPTVKAAADDARGTEGDKLTASGAFEDAENDDLTLTMPDDAPGTFMDNEDGTWEWELATTDDVELDSITVTASDGELTATDSFDFEAENADPLATAVLNKTVECNATLDLSWTDAGADDTHDVVINWDDESGDNQDGLQDLGTVESPSAQLTHTFPGTGTYDVVATVTDDDEGTDSDGDDVVFADTMSAILDPIKAGGASVFKIGSTVPIKVTVTDCSGAAVAGYSGTVGLTQTDTKPASDPAVAVEAETVPTNGKLMAFNGEHYHYVLSTKKSQFATGDLTPGTYRTTVTLRGTDGNVLASKTATFDLKK